MPNTINAQLSRKQSKANLLLSPTSGLSIINGRGCGEKFHSKNYFIHLKETVFQKRFLHQINTGIFCLGISLCPGVYAANVFINEFHYDNGGTDIDEGIEIAGTAGIDLENWQLLFYNGLNGSVYRSENLGGIIPNQSNGYGTVSFSFSNIQNGPADAFALIDAGAQVTEFISYEGSVIATGGLAAGMSSIDVGISEASDSAAGFSIQRSGIGNSRDDFNWLYLANSFGNINAGQTFTSSTVPLPAAGWLMFSGLAGLVWRGIALRSPGLGGLRRNLRNQVLQCCQRVASLGNGSPHHQITTTGS